MEIAIDWSNVFGEIRQWLALTAKGKLHAEDQPLEPLLIDSKDKLIIPYDLFANAPDSEFLFVSNKFGVLIAEHPESVDENSTLLSM